MFRNYIKIAVRNLAKQKVFSAINILGLAVGLAGAVLTFLFVENELSYDRFHENADNLYRIYTKWLAEDGSVERTFRGVPMPMGPAIEEYFPEISKSIRFLPDSVTVKTEGDLFSERILMVDRHFFEVFSFPLLKGNPSAVLSQENSLVLSESQARKYFGDDDPIGRPLTLMSGQEMGDFIVTGVAADPPPNSSITFDVLTNIDSANRLNINEMWLDNWGAFGWQNYILVRPENSIDGLERKFTGFTEPNFAEFNERYRNRRGWKGDGVPFSLALQPLSHVHLDPVVSGSLNMNAIFILSGIALIVLVIACINFMNLAIGRASTRSMEVGVRKVLGAERRHLIRQFWGEFLIVSGIAMVAGLVLTELLLPVFNRLSARSLSLGELMHPFNILILILLFVFVGVVSGSYPALVMSRFRPVEILRGKLRLGGKKPLTRALVIIQFALSVFLILSTIVMGRQIHFILNADPGFDRENIVVMRMQEPDAEEASALLRLMRDRLRQEPNVLSISAMAAGIGQVGIYPFQKDGREINVYQNRVDYDYFETMGIGFLAGRDFSPEFPSDVDGVVVNEKLVKELEIEDPIGKPLEGYSSPLTIIGVVDDYINQDFRQPVLPAMHVMKPGWGIRYVIVRVSSRNIQDSLSLLQRTWKDIQPDKPFLYSFLDESFRDIYDEELRWGMIVRYSTVLAVIIACMGIFGLTSITVNRRTKEIGIRKVLGANVPQIINTLTREFLFLVAVANIVAWPIAYFAMRTLLDNYHHRIGLGMQYFLLAGLVSFAAAITTTVYLALRAAVANPVDSLRYE